MLAFHNQKRVVCRAGAQHEHERRWPHGRNVAPACMPPRCHGQRNFPLGTARVCRTPTCMLTCCADGPAALPCRAAQVGSLTWSANLTAAAQAFAAQCQLQNDANTTYGRELATACLFFQGSRGRGNIGSQRHRHDPWAWPGHELQ